MILEDLITWLSMRPRLFGQIAHPIISITEPTTIAELPPAQKKVAEEFRRGIAEALGVPEEAVREDIIVKWMRRWAKTFIKPGYEIPYL